MKYLPHGLTASTIILGSIAIYFAYQNNLKAKEIARLNTVILPIAKDPKVPEVTLKDLSPGTVIAPGTGI